MTVQTVKLAGKKFVILAEKDFRKIQEKLEDKADAKEARKALAAIKSGKSKPIPWEQVKAELRVKGNGR